MQLPAGPAENCLQMHPSDIRKLSETEIRIPNESGVRS